jgi:hypothetical protein
MSRINPVSIVVIVLGAIVMLAKMLLDETFLQRKAHFEAWKITRNLK